MQGAVDYSVDDVVAAVMRIAPHKEITHHIPGRIRLKILPSGVDNVRDLDLEGLVARIPGVLDLRVNILARSIMIEYDRNRLPYDLWESLNRVKEHPETGPELIERLHFLWERGNKTVSARG